MSARGGSVDHGTPNPVRADVVIVGGGLSGLAAATALVEAGRTVTVLEASSKVGGRMTGEEISFGDRKGYVDLGGQWIGRTHGLLLELADWLGLETFPWHHEGRTILHFDDRHGYVGDDFMPWPGEPDPLTDEERADYKSVKNAYEALAKQVPRDRPWTWSQAQAKDDQTLEQWVNATARTSFGRWTVATLARIGGSGAFEPHQTSALHYLWTQRVAAQQAEPEHELFCGGAGQIPELLKGHLPEGVVRTGQEVWRIQQGGDEVGVFTRASDVPYVAPRVIVAVPPPRARRIEFLPSPDMRVHLVEGSLMGAIIKVHVIYDEPWWRRDELSGIGQGNLDTIEFTADSSGPDDTDTPGILTSFIAGDRAEKLTGLTRAQREEFVLDDYATYFGERAKTMRHTYIEKNWPAEPLITGAFTTYMKPRIWTAYGMAIREPFGRIHWAGTETAVRWPGYFEGALDAAGRAVHEVLTA